MDKQVDAGTRIRAQAAAANAAREAELAERRKRERERTAALLAEFEPPVSQATGRGHPRFCLAKRHLDGILTAAHSLEIKLVDERGQSVRPTLAGRRLAMHLIEGDRGRYPLTAWVYADQAATVWTTQILRYEFKEPVVLTDWQALREIDAFGEWAGPSSSWWRGPTRRFVETVKEGLIKRIGLKPTEDYGKRAEYRACPWEV